MSDFFSELYGNDQLKLYIKTKISDGTLPHALIFEGADGSGKSTVAHLTAMSLEPNFAEKIQKDASPDVTVHRPDEGKKSIGVELIREIKGAAYIKPQELSVRVFIIEDAHLMTAAAQNALLKVLEEPPHGVYFFLLCENSSALLPTVRSRAPVMKLSVFSDEELGEYVLSKSKKAAVMNNSSRQSFEMLIRSCYGSIGAAFDLLESTDTHGQKLSKLTYQLIELLSQAKRDKLILFFAKNRFKREELGELLSELSLSMRDMLKIKYGELRSPLFFTDAEEAENLSASFARSTLINIYDTSESLRFQLSLNVNVDAFSLRTADALSDAAGN